MMQKKVSEVQDKLAVAEYEGSAGGGMIKIRVNGKGEVLKLKIDSSLIDPKDPEMLEDLIVASFNNAKKEADSASENALSGIAGNLGLPPGLKLPF